MIVSLDDLMADGCLVSEMGAGSWEMKVWQVRLFCIFCAHSMVLNSRRQLRHGNS
jgi:hypothetical protein